MENSFKDLFRYPTEGKSKSLQEYLEYMDGIEEFSADFNSVMERIIPKIKLSSKDCIVEP